MAKKFTAYGLPWGDKVGKDVTNCKTSEEVIKKAGLDFQVEKCELVASMPFSLKGNNIVLIKTFLLVLLNLNMK